MTRKSIVRKRNGLIPEQVPLKEPIAIIGIGCRLPGGIDSPEKFWSMLRDGVHSVSEIPSNRIDVERYYDPRPATPGKMMTRWGGFLENIDQFDASFFGIAPREAERLDPQQRLLLEVAWEALEDAGQVPEQLKGSRTGVFTGLFLSDFEARLFADPSQMDFYMTTGSGRYAASGRVSYFLGLQGPSITIDTACSSSLVAVHLACQSLWSGESSLALAAGASIILQPHISIAYSQSKMMAPDGRCKFGDASADGYVRSEGVALVVLKRLSEALTGGDSIYALIRGSAVNNDGQTSGFLATPGQQGQEEMLRLAYHSAGVDPRQVQYVEAHGTGTRAGDPIELGAIGAILGKGRSPQMPLLVGSVKTNLGHTEGAAGVAGLIKVALSLKHGEIPASLHLNEFNPNVPWQELNITIPRILTPWLNNMEKIAGVSAFGIVGTNAHVVLAEAPHKIQQALIDESGSTYILPLSAQTPEALKTLAKTYLSFLSKETGASLHNICYSASCRRTHHSTRLAVLGKSHQEIADQLSAYLAQGTHTNQDKIIEQPKIAFVFPGQGAQWLGMGRELLKQNSVFREVLTQCDKAIKRWTDWSVLEQLALEEDSPSYRLNEISVIQPTLFAIEIALAEVWRSWGVEPSAVIGHSMGEVAAAYIAGALSLDDAARVICKRSQLMQRTSGKGAMAVVGLPYDQAEKLLYGYEDKLSLAVQNSPKSTVLSGDPGALDVVMKQLHSQEIFCRLIKVDVASHSPQMDPIRPDLIDSLNGIRAQTASVPFYSTVTQDIHDGKSLDAEYWGRNLRQPVRFSETIQQLLNDEHIFFIEMSPHPTLLSSLEEIRVDVNKPAYGFASLRRDQSELAAMLGELGSLYRMGYPIDWNRLYPNGGEIVSLPEYPWQRERYWFETSGPSSQTRPGAHPLLGQYIRSANGEHIWETAISTTAFAYLDDHRVRGSAVFPAAGYVEMVLAAASEIYGSNPFIIKKLAFREAFLLPWEEDRILQLVLIASTLETAEFHIYSRSTQDDSTNPWTLHASGEIELENEVAAGQNVSLKDLLPRQIQTSSEEFYHLASARGLEYGSNFRTITHLTQQQTGILAKIKLPEVLIAQTAKYRLHPVLIDACFQTLLATLPESNQDTYLPISLESLQAYALPNFGDELWCYATPTTGKLVLFNSDGQMVMSVLNLHMQRVEAKVEDIQNLLYEVEWQESAIPSHDLRGVSEHWLIFADQQNIGKSLAEKLQLVSQTCTLIYTGNIYQAITENSFRLDPVQPAHFQQLLKDVAQPIHHIVHSWSLDNDPVPAMADSNLSSILYLTQAIAQQESMDSPRLWLITRGAQTIPHGGQPEPVSISQSPVWGMGAVIANEFPNLRCTRVDLSPNASWQDIELLERTLQSGDDEDQVALRNGQRYVARLKRHQLSAANVTQNIIRQKVEKNQSFQVQVTTPGILDSLSLKPVLKRSPKAGEVEIAVKATGLNFMNVMSAMGIYPGYPNGVGPLGIECAGTIVNVGEGVTDFQVGDEVTGIAFNSLSSHAITDARLIVRKPTFLSFEEAASIPIAYVTAYYALISLGRLRANERILIHSATGGVGLAAIQLAKRVGAQIFATAGSAEKRQYLQALGIPHVMDSRSLSFADDIMEITHGEGVDVVLNSLTGNAIAKGLEALKPYGRFLEIGKRAIYQNSKIGLLPFQNNLSYFAIDLDKLSHERVDIVSGILCEIFNFISNHEVAPLPVKIFPVSQVSDAFRLIAQAKHTGKIAITMEDSNASFELPAGATSIHPDGTYLITGGLGDLGLTFTRWLTERGAQHIVLLGRSKPSDDAQRLIGELQAAGVEVIIVHADVADIDQLSKVFAQIKEDLPPLKGVIHAAGLLADGTLIQMDWERFSLAYAPKVSGAWNLHTLTADQSLDFFILFSSVAAILGTPGQINYAAGNAFLDALARFREAQNLPALSINWGPWSEIGLASRQENRGALLSTKGLMSITPTQGLQMMDTIMAQKTAQVSAMSFNAKKWRSSYPSAVRSSFFNDLLNPIGDKVVESNSQHNIRKALLDIEAGKQRKVLFEACVLEQVAHVLRMPPSRLPTDKPLKTVGLDSLMSLELRNRLEDALGIPIPAAAIWNYPTVISLTAFLATKIDIPLETAAPNVQAQTITLQPVIQEETTTDVDNLSKAELDELLMQELNIIEDLLRGKDDE